MTIYTTDYYKVTRLIVCGKPQYDVIKIGEKGSLLCTHVKKRAIGYCNMLNKLAIK